MAYELEITREEGHILAQVSGVRTRETVSSAAGGILESCRQHQVEKALIDVRRLNGRFSVFDSLMLIVEEFPKLKKEQVIKKAAIVDAKARWERLNFFEGIARRRGFNIRVFTNLDNARKWLLRDEEVYDR